MLLFCAKTIMKESRKFELARLKEKRKKNILAVWRLSVSSGGSRKSLRVVLLVGEANLPQSGLARKRGSLGGSGGMPPRKFLEIWML